MTSPHVSDSVSFPVGMIIAALWPGVDKAGWLYCDGRALTDPEKYPELDHLLYQHTLPDLRGRYLWGADSVVMPFQLYWSRTNQYGAFTKTPPPGGVTNADNIVVLDEKNMPSHQHFGLSDTNLGEAYWPYGQTNGETINIAKGVATEATSLYGTTSAGGDPNNGNATVGFSIFQPSYSVNYFIYSGVISS
jgi:hypothetical protein